jgi:hypothetical protein
MTPTQEMVNESMRKALDNNYAEIRTWSAEDLAIDMLDYDATFEGCSLEDVLPLVENWLERNGEKDAGL